MCQTVGFRPLGQPGTEVLPHQSGGGIAEAPGGQQCEHHDAYSDGIARYCGAAKSGDDLHQEYPTGSGHQELGDATRRDAYQRPDQVQLDTHVFEMHPNPATAATQVIQPVQHANAAPDIGRRRRR